MAIIDHSAILLLDLPQGALAGIDLLSFTTTVRFQGVKTLPAGLHCAFVGSSTAFSERHAVWFEIKQGPTGAGPPLFVSRWDPSTEALVPVTDQAEVLRWRANLGSIWREGLTPYRQTAATKVGESDEAPEELVDWSKLTSDITPQLLSRITGGDQDRWTLSSASSAKRDLEEIPGLSPEDIKGLQADKDLNFLPIDLKRTWREGATGRERTEAAQDRSWALNALVAHHCIDGNGMDIVGELQFCFLMVLTINNFSCLEQWKRILTLLFTCRASVATRSALFTRAIKALTLQLQHCRLADSGLIDLADVGGSLLKQLLTRFRKGLQGLAGPGVEEIVDELDDLEDYLRTEHGWQFGGTFARTGVLDLEDGEQVAMDTTAFDEDDETGEYAPQIVDLTPEQARMLGVHVGESGSWHAGTSTTALREAVADPDEDGDGRGGTGARVAEQEPASQSEEEADDLEDMDARY